MGKTVFFLVIFDIFVSFMLLIQKHKRLNSMTVKLLKNFTLNHFLETAAAVVFHAYSCSCYVLISRDLHLNGS